MAGARGIKGKILHFLGWRMVREPTHSEMFGTPVLDMLLALPDSAWLTNRSASSDGTNTASGDKHNGR